MLTVRGHGGRDEGQVMLLILGAAVIVGLLVTVVADASALYLQRRALVATADAAALAAAQEVDAAAVYGDRFDDALPLDPELGRAAVVRHVGTMSEGRLSQVRIDAVRVDGDRVEVSLSARARLPFLNTITGAADGTLIRATAAATSRLG